MVEVKSLDQGSGQRLYSRSIHSRKDAAQRQIYKGIVRHSKWVATHLTLSGYLFFLSSYSSEDEWLLVFFE
jgi:hypothetical protein